MARPETLRNDQSPVGETRRSSNHGEVPQPVTVAFKDLGYVGPVHARDLWAHKELGVMRDSFTATPPKGGVVMLRLWQ